jgi:hypothetical protein
VTCRKSRTTTASESIAATAVQDPYGGPRQFDLSTLPSVRSPGEEH